ncbi:hypothetical protein NM688_g8615 [Phlebia brevispora]|uniref:Uncharacterized protein n=1 Tax=Phlebia brevispora TaxID=194682 RepID=A0ACC1RPN8_9APHY|nr:hypothetical protein NM688_g8615 [Phlebia brevispora]
MVINGDYLPQPAYLPVSRSPRGARAVPVPCSWLLQSLKSSRRGTSKWRREGKTDHHARKRLISQTENKWCIVVEVSEEYLSDNVIIATLPNTASLYASPAVKSSFRSSTHVSRVTLFSPPPTLRSSPATESTTVLPTEQRRLATVQVLPRRRSQAHVDWLACVCCPRGFNPESKELDAEVLKKYIYSGHVAEYMESLEREDGERKQFSTYLADGVGSEDIEETYTDAYAAIREDLVFKPAEKTKDWKAESLKHKAKRFTLEERKARIAAKIETFKTTAGAGVEAAEGEEDEEDEKYTRYISSSSFKTSSQAVVGVESRSKDSGQSRCSRCRNSADLPSVEMKTPATGFQNLGSDADDRHSYNAVLLRREYSAACNFPSTFVSARAASRAASLDHPMAIDNMEAERMIQLKDERIVFAQSNNQRSSTVHAVTARKLHDGQQAANDRMTTVQYECSMKAPRSPLSSFRFVPRDNAVHCARLVHRTATDTPSHPRPAVPSS